MFNYEINFGKMANGSFTLIESFVTVSKNNLTSLCQASGFSFVSKSREYHNIKEETHQKVFIVIVLKLCKANWTSQGLLFGIC